MKYTFYVLKYYLYSKIKSIKNESPLVFSILGVPAKQHKWFLRAHEGVDLVGGLPLPAAVPGLARAACRGSMQSAIVSELGCAAT